MQRRQLQGCGGGHGASHALTGGLLGLQGAQHLAPVVGVKVRRELRILPMQHLRELHKHAQTNVNLSVRLCKDWRYQSQDTL